MTKTTEELKTKIEDCLPIENYGVRSIDCGGAGIDKAVNKLLFLFQSEIEAAEKAKEEQIEKDYIAWVFHNSYGDSRPYKGETPFAEWKTKAEAQDMSDWK